MISGGLRRGLDQVIIKNKKLKVEKALVEEEKLIEIEEKGLELGGELYVLSPCKRLANQRIALFSGVRARGGKASMFVWLYTEGHKANSKVSQPSDSLGDDDDDRLTE